MYHSLIFFAQLLIDYGIFGLILYRAESFQAITGKCIGVHDHDVHFLQRLVWITGAVFLSKPLGLCKDISCSAGIACSDRLYRRAICGTVPLKGARYLRDIPDFSERPSHAIIEKIVSDVVEELTLFYLNRPDRPIENDVHK